MSHSFYIRTTDDLPSPLLPVQMFSPARSSELLVEQLIIAQYFFFLFFFSFSFLSFLIQFFLKWVISCHSSENAFNLAVSAAETGQLSGAEVCVLVLV